jgi:hypothetical protein
MAKWFPTVKWLRGIGSVRCDSELDETELLFIELNIFLIQLSV